MGCPRSGTSFLARLIGSHSDIAYLEEPRMGELAANLIKNNTRLLMVKESMKVLSKDAYKTEKRYHGQVKLDSQTVTNLSSECLADVRTFIERSIQEFLKETQKSVFLEKTPENVLYVEELKSVFPEARFIHIIRDGRDVASSFLFRNLFQKWKNPVQGDSPIDQLGRLWKRCVENGRRASKTLGDDYYEIRYEDLVEDLRSTMVPLMKWMGLQWSSEMDLASEELCGGFDRGRVRAFKKRLTKEQINLFEKRQGNLLRDLGYGLESSWSAETKQEEKMFYPEGGQSEEV